MKKNNLKEKIINKRYKDIFFGIIYIILGILVIFIPYINKTPEYNVLISKEVIISSVVEGYSPGKHSHGWYYIICTEDGDNYRINGKYKDSDIEELSKNQKVIIKYYEKFSKLKMTKFIKEMTYEDEKIITYTNYDEENKPVALGLGIFIILFGTMFVIDTQNIIKFLKKLKRNIKKLVRKIKKNNVFK